MKQRYGPDLDLAEHALAWVLGVLIAAAMLAPVVWFVMAVWGRR